MYEAPTVQRVEKRYGREVNGVQQPHPFDGHYTTLEVVLGRDGKPLLNEQGQPHAKLYDVIQAAKRAQMPLFAHFSDHRYDLANLGQVTDLLQHVSNSELHQVGLMTLRLKAKGHDHAAEKALLQMYALLFPGLEIQPDLLADEDN